MKTTIAILWALLVPVTMAETVPEQPGSTFGSNYKEKQNPNPENTQWGWNDDTDDDLSIINTTDRFKGPSTGVGWRVQVNKGTFIRIDNDLWKKKEPPDVNSGIGVEPTK